MDKSEILNALRATLADVLDQPSLVLTAESSAATVEGWDSLAQINFLAAIEDEYKIRFSLHELDAVANVGDIADLIARKLPA
jgi:acyl carrier protein